MESENKVASLLFCEDTCVLSFVLEQFMIDSPFPSIFKLQRRKKTN